MRKRGRRPRARLVLVSGASGRNAEAQRTWAEVCATFDNACAYCRARVPLTRDHIIPASQGGLTKIHNQIPACALCNRTRGDTNALVFLAEMERTHRPHPLARERIEAALTRRR